jgi:predicted ArsR family transcriptional regulator
MVMTSWLDRLIGETQGKLLRLLRRSSRTITELASALRLTDNAVRMHVSALRRDGIVADVGTQRDTGGKPARLYGLTAEGQELFPKAYAAVLSRIVEEVVSAEGPDRARALLREVGAKLAGPGPRDSDPARRVANAAAALRSIGADVDVEQTTDGWKLQGYACPLSAVTADHPEACELARGLVAELTGASVSECCERGGAPRCAFTIGR